MEGAMQRGIKVALTVAVVAVQLAGAALVVAGTAHAGPTNSENEKKNRSRFEYHDGHAEERRPYRRPDPDTDPTNLRFEELRERINRLEERLEFLENNVNRDK
ncbi:hypothetical protein ACIQW5_24605 [Methylorubrum thiocyanatum]|uniref:hypothetical protein n=1 Tax=Methylorubrum thiocyanatum TaxID=47958 RepID=UPI00383B8D11